DFPEIIVDSIPIADFISDKTNLDSALRILKTRVEKLENLNPSCFSLACNTAHLLFGDLQMVTSVPFISIIEEVASEINREGLKTVGLLGTPVTIKSRLFEEALNKRKIRLIVPTVEQQKMLEGIIRGVIAQKVGQQDKLNLLAMADSLKLRGAKGIILGCTELPLVFPKKDFSVPVFDSLEVLARALLKKSFKEKL
ncbi:MAG: amino acid racemase, partial [Candidatus Curtissbacteria bacterium]|nr:amino acid racemase [Candidatus Curtissbacteria bacterium]